MSKNKKEVINIKEKGIENNIGGKKKMIIDKTDSGEYVCRVKDTVYKIPPKHYYLALKQDLENIIEPTDEELIRLGKLHHPFYQKENSLENVDNILTEIDTFENSQE